MASGRFILSPLLCALLAGTAMAAQGPLDSQATVLQLDLAPQPLGDALSQLAEAAGLQIVFYSEAAQGIRAPRLAGSFDLPTALNLLLADTPLEYEFVSADTIAVRARNDRSRAAGEDMPSPRSAAPADAGTGHDSFARGSHERPARNRDANRALELEEVLVTARRRSEDLQDTPVAVTALSGDALDVRAVRTLDALAQFVPNLQFDGAAPLSGAAYNATIFIRGVGQNDFAIFSDPGVAVYLDGVYLGRSIGGVMDLVDVAQVEVLRGPQGTLFGRNTIGGAVILNSQEPDASFGGNLAVSAGSLERREVRANLNLPINDVLATRLSAATVQRDGYGRRLTDGQQLGNKDATIGRAQLAWRPSEDLAANLTIDTTRLRQGSAPLTLIDVAMSGVPFLNLYNSLVAPTLNISAPDGSTTLSTAWLTDDIDATYAGGRSINNLDSDGVALRLDSVLGATDLRSITAWRRLDARFARDGDNTPFTFRETYNDDRQEQFSQELQWSGSTSERRLDWVSGLYLFQENASEEGRAILAPGLYDDLEALNLATDQTWCGLAGANPRPVNSCPSSLRYGGAAFHDNNVLADLDVDLLTRVRNRSIAVFGQGTHRFAESWSVTAGMRWTRDDKDIELEHRRRASGVYIVGSPGSPQQFSVSSSQLTPKLGLEWQASSDVMLYASYARGFKSGGVNGRPLVSSEEVTPYDPEIVDSYELGAKTRWFDGRMIANAAFFYNEYRDMQLSINATPQNFVRNAGAARITGSELEVAARLTRGLDLNLATGYLDGSYTKLDSQLATLQPPLTVDKELVKAPQWTVSAGLQYQWSVGAGSFRVRGDYIHKDQICHDVFNDVRLTQPAFDIANAYASFTTFDERWELALFGTNLTSERYRISGNSSVGMGLAESTFSAPREIGATLRMRF
jgi:iron complex outermembrane recepter protein